MYLPMTCRATAGGITNMPTSKSAEAKLITKQLVTVRSLLVVSIDNMTSIFPITVTNISSRNEATAIIVDQLILFKVAFIVYTNSVKLSVVNSLHAIRLLIYFSNCHNCLVHFK